MKSSLKWFVIAVAAAIQTCTAQTYTDCNPLTETCDPNDGLATSSFNTDFTNGQSAFDGWTVTSGTVSSTTLGAEFVINQQGDAPTIASDFYIFFGYLEVTMRASNGTGIVSTAILQSDDLDEIDWEQVSTFNDQIQTNYFGKGNTTSYDRGTTVAVSSPSNTFHTYGISWTAEKTEWFIDGVSVRTLNYADALNGENYPQTPMQIRIGIWAGGDPSNAPGTIQWAGGETDYSQGPFKMYVESVNVVNYNPAESYSYGDNSGSWTSINQSNATDGDGAGAGPENSASDTISNPSISVVGSTRPVSTWPHTVGHSSPTILVPTTRVPTTVVPTVIVPISSVVPVVPIVPPVVVPTTTAPVVVIPTSGDGMIPIVPPVTTVISGGGGSTLCITGAPVGTLTPSAGPSQTGPATTAPTAFFNGARGVPSCVDSLWAIIVVGLAAVWQV
ncbi:concanavalin A-like lectin/glucanase domain-containing protein [Aspergillus crustosus]